VVISEVGFGNQRVRISNLKNDYLVIFMIVQVEK